MSYPVPRRRCGELATCAAATHIASHATQIPVTTHTHTNTHTHTHTYTHTAPHTYSHTLSLTHSLSLSLSISQITSIINLKLNYRASQVTKSVVYAKVRGWHGWHACAAAVCVGYNDPLRVGTHVVVVRVMLKDRCICTTRRMHVLATG